MLPVLVVFPVTLDGGKRIPPWPRAGDEESNELVLSAASDPRPSLSEAYPRYLSGDGVALLKHDLVAQVMDGLQHGCIHAPNFRPEGSQGQGGSRPHCWPLFNAARPEPVRCDAAERIAPTVYC